MAPYYRTTTAMTQDQADDVALARLWQLALYADTIAGSLVPDPTIDEGDVVAFDDWTTGTGDRYWLDAVTYPLLAGTMTVAGARVHAVVVGGE